MARRVAALVIAAFACAACGAVQQSSRSVDSMSADQASIRFLAPSPAGASFDIAVAQGGAVTAVWRGPCGAGLAAGCSRAVAIRTTWSKEQVGQLLSATARAGFPKLAQSPGGSRASSGTGGWSLQVTTVEAGVQWTGLASGSASESNPYAAIWGPAAFPTLSTASGPGQSVQSAAELALRNAGVGTPYAMIAVQSVMWPQSCLGLPSTGSCKAAAVDGWLLAYRSGDGSWWWVRTDKTGGQAVVDVGSRPVLCGSSGAGCAPPAPTCQACPPAPGSASASAALPDSAGRGRA